MGKRRKIRRRRLSRKEVNVTREAEYIVQCAAERQGRVVSLGQLIFFSTETGDAWVLDPADGLARCLARDGDARPLGIIETPDRFGIEWEAAYEIVGNTMILRDRLGRERSILGYPVSEIRHAIARIEREG